MVTLVTPVDNTYKIRTTRIIELGFGEPVMRIKTIFERTAATSKTNNPIGVWVISQTQDPVRCYVPVPTPSIFSQGYTQLGSGLPAQFRNTNGLVSFARNTATSHKLGFDAGTLLWVGTNVSLRLDAPRVPGLAKSAYPDGGSSTEIYTNPTQTAPYVEMENACPFGQTPRGRPTRVHDHLHPLLPARIRSGRRSSQNPRSALMRWCGKLTKRLECEAAKAGVRSPCG